jgi:hypothetical protein
MNKHLFVSCFAAALLFAGASTAPAWADDNGQSLGSQPSTNEQADPNQYPADEINGGDGHYSFWLSPPSYNVASASIVQQEESEGNEAEPQPEGGSD